MLRFNCKTMLAYSWVLILIGCATPQNKVAQSKLSPPVRMVVMESPMEVESGRLESVLAPDAKPGTEDSATLLNEGRMHAEGYAMSSMEAALNNDKGFQILKPRSRDEREFDKIQHIDLSRPITEEEADWLRQTLGADAILRFGITDYGLTPRAWRNGYITFEITSTLAIAGVIAYSGSTAAKAAAGAYLAQETAEETAEAYAGFWALDVVSRPVRVEAELIQLNPLQTIWKDSDTGLSDTKLSRLTRKIPLEEEHKQLDQSTDNAIRKLTAEISMSLSDLPAYSEEIRHTECSENHPEKCLEKRQ